MRNLILFGCLLCAITFLVGCEKEGDAEKAGRKMDEAMDEARKEL